MSTRFGRSGRLARTRIASDARAFSTRSDGDRDGQSRTFVLRCSPRRLSRRPAWSISFSNGPSVLQSLVREVWKVTVTTGTIKKVMADRGFGFIAAEDAKEYFFHRGGLDSSLDFDRLVGGEKGEVGVGARPEATRGGPRPSRVPARA